MYGKIGGVYGVGGIAVSELRTGEVETYSVRARLHVDEGFEVGFCHRPRDWRKSVVEPADGKSSGE